MTITVRRESGFTYIAVLMAIAVLGIGLAAVGEIWSTRIRRDREEELLYVGQEIRLAIQHYYLSAGGGTHQLPRSLQDLLTDERSVVPQHYLRRLYRDPMTGEADWQLLLTDDGGIYGVYSSSQAQPIKRANFRVGETSFVDAQCYCEWKFAFRMRGRGGWQPFAPADSTNISQ
jgi:type II secretory pathway pseudopilin PulG